MAIGDPDFALEKLRRFLDLIAESDHDEIRKLLPVIEAIAKQLEPGKVSELKSVPLPLGGVSWGPARVKALRLVGIVEHQADLQRISGTTGPTLAAGQLHPWVWDAAANLWDDGHYEPAVHEAAKAVELRTQLEIDRRDLDGKDLYSKAFSLDDPQPGAPRLRFPDIDRAEQPKRWTSAHEGAMFLGMGCAQGIRNPQAHPSPDITEQEALEQLAALSVLARWVDACEVASAADDPDRA